MQCSLQLLSFDSLRQDNLASSTTHSMYELIVFASAWSKEQDQTRVTILDGGLTSTSDILFSEKLSCLRRDALQLGDHGNMLPSAEASRGQP